MRDPRLSTLRTLADQMVSRGHDPECSTGVGQCERCAKAHAGKQVLAVLDMSAPATSTPAGPSWTTSEEWSAVEDAAIAAWTTDGPQTYPLLVEDALRAAIETLGPAVALRRAGLVSTTWPSRSDVQVAYLAAQQVTPDTSLRFSATVVAAVKALGPFLHTTPATPATHEH